MNDICGLWSLFARVHHHQHHSQDHTPDNPNTPWILIGLGVVFIVGSVYHFISGRMKVGYRGPGGIGRWTEINGEDNPIQFLGHIMMMMFGTGLITYGVWMLLT